MVYKGKLGVVDDLFKVKKFVMSYFKSEEPIPDKSKSRVIESLARSIRRTPPLPRGSCQFCETMSEKLIPMPMVVCLGCVNKFIKKSDNLKFLKWEYGDFYCDWCLGRGYKKFHINPWIDKKCLDKIGRRHISDMGSLNAKIARQRNRMIIK